MLSLQKSGRGLAQCNPNLLPCRINHSGPVNEVERYWKPESGADSMQTAYFRGRKLHGRALKVPEGYRGSVLRISDSPATRAKDAGRAQSPDFDEDAEMCEDDEPIEEKVAVEIASFDELTVWGHESKPASGEDPYAMAIEEWIDVAEAIHSTSFSKVADGKRH